MQETEYDFSEEIVDLEQFAKEGKVPPARCKGYRIRIDNQAYVVTDVNFLNWQQNKPNALASIKSLRVVKSKKLDLMSKLTSQLLALKGL